VPNTLLSVPHHQQRSHGDCLVACATMALAYLNVSVRYEHVLKLLDVKPYGTPGSRLNNLVDLGVRVRYAHGSMDELTFELDCRRPCIALVRTSQLPYWTYATDHAVVVVGNDEQTVYINDPAFEQAPQQVSRAEFELAWLEFDYRYGVIWK